MRMMMWMMSRMVHHMWRYLLRLLMVRESQIVVGEAETARATATLIVSIVMPNRAIPATSTLVIIHHCAKTRRRRHVFVHIGRDLLPIGLEALVGLAQNIVHFSVPTNRWCFVHQAM